MSKRIQFRLVLSLALLAGLIVLTRLVAQGPEPKNEPAAAQANADSPAVKADAPATPVKPKPLSDSAKKGLSYLISQQHPARPARLDHAPWGRR